MGARLQWGCADYENSLPRSLSNLKSVFFLTPKGDLALKHKKPPHPVAMEGGNLEFRRSST